MKSCYYDQANNAIADLCDYYGEGMILTRINTPKENRGRGVGGALLRRILHDADEQQVTIWLEIAPSDGLTAMQLRRWYERHGFKNVGGIYRRSPG